jgi:hypothetical protein
LYAGAISTRLCRRSSMRVPAMGSGRNPCRQQVAAAASVASSVSELVGQPRPANTMPSQAKFWSTSLVWALGSTTAARSLAWPVRGVNVGEAAASRENCARLRDELWFKGREWFQDRTCSMPKDDALIAELTSPTYAFTSTGKMVVESKADMKKRGMRSPDLADPFLLTFACGERRKERYRRPVRKSSAWAA